jgi:uncharacterized zinc-type alcohol dehydrogenase-like protein
MVEGHFGATLFPVVPGHEIVGRVAAVGNSVTKFNVGDTVAVSTYIDSCGKCQPCRADREHMCVEGMTGVTNTYERDGVSRTYGGYSNNYVVKEHFALRVPANLDPAEAAPLMCGGLTVYQPLQKWNVGPGMTVGVVGLGGLGHLAVKMAAAMGAEVVVFSTSESKSKDALSFGATDVVVGDDQAQLAKWNGKIDLILDTVTALHEIDPLIFSLKPNGTLCVLGVPLGQMQFSVIPIVVGEKTITGSMLGGIEVSQQMLDFCGEHDLGATIELIRADEINQAYARLARNDVRYRFVVDLSTLAS